jgi:hypothetical protein
MSVEIKDLKKQDCEAKILRKMFHKIVSDKGSTKGASQGMSEELI